MFKRILIPLDGSELAERGVMQYRPAIRADET